MKTLFALIISTILLVSCNSSKSNETLYGATWELEYISGPKIAFDALFDAKTPQLEFNKETLQVIGNSGCNGFSAPFTTEGNTLSFGEPGPATLMYCGEGEPFFKNTIKKINAFKIDEDGKLLLMQDDIMLMRFKKQTEANTVSDTTETAAITTNTEATNYFKANGTEPFWGLEINEQSIVLKTMEDTITVSHVEAIKAMDANVKLYKIETEATLMNIQLSQTECVNAMSGEKFPYTVKVDYTSTGAEEGRVLEGCGAYVTDYRLHDIWVLETMNGKVLDETNYPKEKPSMEINTTTNTFTGNTGCNIMNGKLFFEPALLRFTDIVTTKKLCMPNNGQEQEFLTALQAATTYTIANNRLTLSNPNGELLVFKKVD
ncbi:MAG TPA: META domain-containing protein [Flavobacteriaceae bacterium]|nr:META domain-containing protein [Flavobacteriaceae bacterium]